MMDKVSSFSNFKFGRRFFERGASKGSFLSVIFAAVEFIMPLLFGISAGWLGTVFIDYYLSPKSALLQLNMAVNIAAAQNKIDPDNGLADFLSANPFSVSESPIAVSVAETQTKVNVEVKNSFATAVLIGTAPQVGAWMQDNVNNKLDFIPIGESFDIYELIEVLYDKAIFKDEEDNNVTKFLYLLSENIPERPTASAAPSRPQRPAPVDDRVTAATEGQEGILDRELLNDLMINPFDEMKKIRIRPKFDGNESIGIEVQWIQNDSILGKLGVAKNDVIRSINGISIKNMGDIANAINSLMNGSRFDVEVLRGNDPIQLTYVVR